MRALEQLNLVAGRTDCGDAAGVSAFDAMRGVATHHSENSALVADSGVVATIARLVRLPCPIRERPAADASSRQRTSTDGRQLMGAN